MKRITCLLCLLGTLMGTISAEPTDNNNDNQRRYRYQIKGVVVDEHDLPLPGATVRVMGTTFGAGTNSDGEFAIRLNDEKEYTLRVSFIGYQPETIEVVSSLEPVALQVKLKPSSNELNEVVVTGSFVEKPLKEVPVITRVVSRQDIQTLNPVNMEALLQYELPGLQLGYNSMSQLSSITYQGMSGDYLLFLIDGERVSGEGSDHNVDFTRFNVDDIERIEVVKGAQSTIYGSNALGGVINIITKSANRPISADLNARYAGSNGQNYNASFGWNKNHFTSYTGWTNRKRNTYTVSDSEGNTTVWGYKIYDFTQKFGYTFSKKLSADVKGTYYWNQQDIRTGRLYQEYYVDYALNAKVKYLLAEGHQLIFGYLYDNYKKDNHYFRIDSTYTNYRNIKQTPRIDYTGKFGKHTVSAGFEGDIEYLKHYMLQDSSHVSNQAYAFYAQEDWNITEGLNIVAGVRADYHEKYKWHVTPKISAMWRVSDFTLRAGYAQGFRSPSLKELYESYDMGGLGYFMIYGNPDLKPETSNQYSVSAEYNKGRLNGSVALAHNRFKNKIEYLSLESENESGNSDLQYVNAEKAKTTSVETILRYRFNFGLLLTGSYVYTNDYSKVDGYNTSLVRPHALTFNLLYTHKFKNIEFNASLNGQWASAFDTYSYSTADDGTYEYTLTSYDARTLCSMNAGVTLLRGISLSLGVENLFNYKDTSADSSLQVPQKGISFVGTLNIHLADIFKW